MFIGFEVHYKLYIIKILLILIQGEEFRYVILGKQGTA